jgi:hypothetical protein
MARRETISSLHLRPLQLNNNGTEYTKGLCYVGALGLAWQRSWVGVFLEKVVAKTWTTSFCDRKAERVIMLVSVISANAHAQC